MFRDNVPKKQKLNKTNYYFLLEYDYGKYSLGSCKSYTYINILIVED